MVAPIDYSLNVKSPFEAAVQGYGIGSNMAQMQAQREATMAQRDAIQAKADAERAEALRQAEARDATKALFSNPNPTAQDFVRVASMLPEKEAASMRANWDLMNKDKQENTLKFSGQVLSAFNSGSPQVGVQLLKDRAEAERNAGQEDQAKAYDTWAQIAEANPQAAMKSMGIMVAQVPGGDKVIESVTKIGQESRAEAKAPAELKEANAKADKAATAAKFAEAEIVINLEKAGWDIKKLQSEIGISERNSRIAAARLDIERESNNIKRKELELKLGEMVQKRDTEVRAKASEIESARGDMDNFLNTADRILATPKSVIKSAAGPVDSRFPTLQPSVADFEALVETLGSQAFMAQIPKMKGTGALSEGEGKKLQSSLQNLSLSQSPERLVENVKEAQRLILKARKNLADKYGVPESVPDTPQAAPTPEETNALLKKYGGK
jgi:hypothetical protein